MMIRSLLSIILAIQMSSIITAQQINRVIVSGIGGQHDVDVENAFLMGYSSYNGNAYTGDIILYENSLQASFDYAAANDYDLMIRSTTGVAYGITLAPSYPSVKLVMPVGSNSYIEAFSGDVINSPVVITGAGTDSNQTAYKLEFYSIDPISPNNASSYANGYIAGQLAFIANTLNCSFDSARTLARVNGSENGSWDIYNGFGTIEMAKIITDPLPVELSSFSSVIKGESIILKWETQTEINNYGFEVQRSNEKDEWSVLGFVKGNGSSNSPKSYSYWDEGIKLTGKYYYRLRQIDNDGTNTYSEILEVNIKLPNELELKQNYPNPFNPATTISFSLPQTGEVILKVYSALGEEVGTVTKGLLEAGEYSFSFNAEGLTSGIYIYRLRMGETTLTRKMLLLK